MLCHNYTGMDQWREQTACILNCCQDCVQSVHQFDSTYVIICTCSSAPISPTIVRLNGISSTSHTRQQLQSDGTETNCTSAKGEMVDSHISRLWCVRHV
jgi:hypothetical protein